MGLIISLFAVVLVLLYVVHSMIVGPSLSQLLKYGPKVPENQIGCDAIAKKVFYKWKQAMKLQSLTWSARDSALNEFVKVLDEEGLDSTLVRIHRTRLIDNIVTEIIFSVDDFVYVAFSGDNSYTLWHKPVTPTKVKNIMFGMSPL